MPGSDITGSGNWLKPSSAPAWQPAEADLLNEEVALIVLFAHALDAHSISILQACIKVLHKVLCDVQFPHLQAYHVRMSSQ